MRLLPLLSSCALITASLLGNAQFTPNRLAILEMPFIPNGTGWIIPTTGGQLVIREFATDGTPGFSVPIPNSGPNMLVSHFQSGGASLTLSPASDKLVFTGFTGTSDGSFNLATSSSTLIPRGIGTVDGAGNYERPFTTSTFFNGAPMNAACTDGVNFWAVGSNSGVCYLGPGVADTINDAQPASTDLQFVAGNLFRGGGAVHQVGNGAPTTPQSLTQIVTSPSGLFGFCLSPAGDVLYTNNVSQVRKWVLSGGTWTNVYNFSTTSFLTRIAVDFSAPQPVIYGVKNTPSALIKWVDAGAPSAAVTLATSNGAAWYGIAFTPGSHCTVGQPCDDGNAATVNDSLDAACQCSGAFVRLASKIILEGPYSSGTGLMSDALRTLLDFPLTEPYTALGLPPSIPGASIAPAVLTTTGNNAIMDWVLAELRTGPVGATVLLRVPALLQRDGDIVALDGVSVLQLPAEPGSYRVAVRHRNHHAAMTALPLSLGAAPTMVDLTLPGTVTWGTDARKNIGGVMALWSGDVNLNAMLSYTGAGNDRDPILSAIGGVVPTNTVSGYRRDDVTMDGVTRYTGSGNDRDPILANIGGVIPTATRAQQLP